LPAKNTACFFTTLSVANSDETQNLQPYSPLDYAYLSWKIKIGQNGTEAKLDEIVGAKVRMCTPVHGLYVWSIAEKPESPRTGVHVFTLAPTISSNLASVPISSDFYLLA